MKLKRHNKNGAVLKKVVFFTTFVRSYQCCGSGYALILVSWIRILIQEDKNDPKKLK
jgi:hypothetical protein